MNAHSHARAVRLSAAARLIALAVGILAVALLAGGSHGHARPVHEPAALVIARPGPGSTPAAPVHAVGRAQAFAAMAAFTTAFARYLQGRLAASALPDATAALRAQIALEHRPRSHAAGVPAPQITSERVEPPGPDQPPAVLQASAVISDADTLTPIAVELARRQHRWVVIAVAESG
jgi:hypothetical protein